MTFITPIQNMGPQKAPPLISAPHVTSTNVRTSPENVLTFSFNLFFKAISRASPKLLNLNRDQPSKKVMFLVKSS